MADYSLKVDFFNTFILRFEDENELFVEESRIKGGSRMHWYAFWGLGDSRRCSSVASASPLQLSVALGGVLGAGIQPSLI